MKVILLKDVKGLGNVHDVVEVKDGYAKNYLFKNKLAVANTPLAQSALKQDLDVLASQEAAKLADANVLKSKLDKITLEFKLKINLGNVFGSISHKMIIDELWEKYQIKLDKFMIGVHNEKTYGLGKHTLIINIYKQINAKLTINVKGDECV